MKCPKYNECYKLINPSKNINPHKTNKIHSLFFVLRISIELKFYWDHNSFRFSYSNFDDLVVWWKLCYFDLFLSKIKSTQFISNLLHWNLLHWKAIVNEIKSMKSECDKHKELKIKQITDHKIARNNKTWWIDVDMNTNRSRTWRKSQYWRKIFPSPYS